MNKIVWQPIHLYQPSFDFAVYLDRKFAEEMLSSKIQQERQENLNKLAIELVKRFGLNYTSPLSFYEDSCLVTQFYIGRNGTWLAIESFSEKDLINKNNKKLVEYHSHNVESSLEAYTLMALFDQWIEYADVLKK